MKRLYFLVLLSIVGLTACTVTVSVNEIEVTANKTVVAPGEAVALKASPNFETSSRILWSTGSKDTRAPGTAFSNDGVGREVTYTAPQAPGVYTVSARSADEASISDSIKITVDEFLGLEPIEAKTDASVTAAVTSLAPGEEKLYLINVSEATAQAGSALFIELDKPLDLTVLDEDRSVYATSDSADSFAAGTAGLDRNTLAPQSIRFGRVIRGPLVTRDASAGREYLKVKNTSNAAVTYNLYVFVIDYLDENEPNDTAATAKVLGDDPDFGDTDIGALESLGDDDYYTASKDGKLCFQNNSWSNVRVNVSNVDGFDQTLAPGGSTSLRRGDLIHVYGEDDGLAAGAAASKYILFIQASGATCQ